MPESQDENCQMKWKNEPGAAVPTLCTSQLSLMLLQQLPQAGDFQHRE